MPKAFLTDAVPPAEELPDIVGISLVLYNISRYIPGHGIVIRLRFHFSRSQCLGEVESSSNKKPQKM